MVNQHMFVFLQFPFYHSNTQTQYYCHCHMWTNWCKWCWTQFHVIQYRQMTSTLWQVIC